MASVTSDGDNLDHLIAGSWMNLEFLVCYYSDVTEKSAIIIADDLVEL